MRSSYKTLVITGIILLCVFVALNWSYTYTEVVRTSGQVQVAEIVDTEIPELSPTTTAMAGWPLKYSVALRSPDLPAVTFFSINSLLLNMLAALVITGVILLFEYSALKRLRQETGGRRRLSVLDLLAATAVVASVVVYWRMLENTANQERSLSNAILSRGGQAVETLSLPSPIVHILPASSRTALRRITEVTLTNPDDALLSQVLKLPYLSKLQIGGGNYDLKLLEQLSGKPLLTQLRISGRTIDAKTVGVIANLKQLQTLNLMRTNITDQAVVTIGKLPRLQALDIIHTDVEFKDIPKLPIASTVRVLKLGHPAPGKQTTATLSDWSQLRRLISNEFDERPNTAPMSLVLRNAPLLESLSLDSLQTYDLDIEQAPMLKELQPLESQVKVRLQPGIPAPEGLALRNIQLTSVPALPEIQCCVDRLETIKLGEGVNASFVIRGQNYVYGRESQPQIDAKNLQRLIDALAGPNGPTSIEISDIDLGGVVLESLFTSNRIKKLSLRDCNIQVMRQLAHVLDKDSALEELDLRDNWVNENDISAIVKSHSKLRTFYFDPTRIGNLWIEDAPKLEHMLSDEMPLEVVQTLRLVNLPVWKDNLDIPLTINDFHIENVPCLTGLSTHRPWPLVSSVTGLRDLKFFAAGGPNLNDEVFANVLACPQMESLTLAYSSISPELFGKIGKWIDLKHLSLSGPNINDTVLAELKPLTGLESLLLDDTAISPATLPIIGGFRNLKRLSLDKINFTPAELEQLSGLGTLAKLRLSGAITAAHIHALQALAGLQILDLSGCNLDRSTLVAIAQLPKLDMLVLQQCQLSDAGFTELIRQREIIVDVTGTDAPLPAMNYLQQAGRLIVDESYLPGMATSNMPTSAAALAMGQPHNRLTPQMREVLAIDAKIPGQVPVKEFSMEMAALFEEQFARQSAAERQFSPGPTYSPPSQMTVSELFGYLLGQAIMNWQTPEPDSDSSNTIEQ